MRVFVSTSDKYIHLLKKHSYFFNKYWGSDQKVEVLCYKMPEFDLPSNYVPISIGGDSSQESWADPLRRVMEKIDDKCFVFLLEDLYIVQQVDLDLIGRMWNEVVEGRASKAVLERQFQGKGKDYGGGLWLVDQGVDYRTTIKPCIYDRVYFLKYLRRNFSIWDFESQNMGLSKKDGAVIIEPKDNDALRTVDVMHRGKFNLELMRYKRKHGILNELDMNLILEKT